MYLAMLCFSMLSLAFLYYCLCCWLFLHLLLRCGASVVPLHERGRVQLLGTDVSFSLTHGGMTYDLSHHSDKWCLRT